MGYADVCVAQVQQIRESVAADVSRILTGSHPLWRALKRFPTVRSHLLVRLTSGNSML